MGKNLVKMRVLGVDPGYGLTGWAVVDFGVEDRSVQLVECGVIETEARLGLSERLLELHEDLMKLIEMYKPQQAGVELLLFQKNVKTAMQVSEARGVVMLALAKEAISTIDVNPMQVKSSITGYGKATKKQIQENVKMICGLEEVPKPDDAADAVAVAICAHSLMQSGLNLAK